MVKPVRIAAVVFAVCAHWAAAAAATIYRCGDTYSDQACAGATMVPTVDAPTAAMREQSEAATRRDAKTADLMAKERLRLEALPAQATIPKPPPRPPVPVAEPTKLAKHKLRRLREPEYLTVVLPRKPGDLLQRKKKVRTAARTARS